MASLKKVKNNFRSRQDSNLRGQSPSDFESDALTTRPRLLLTYFNNSADINTL